MLTINLKWKGIFSVKKLLLALMLAIGTLTLLFCEPLINSIFFRQETRHYSNGFIQHLQQPKRKRNESVITIISTGDILLARTVNFLITKNNNPNLPFENTTDLLSNAEVTVVNLENPLITNCPLTNGGMVFCGDQQNVEGLAEAGIDIVNLANNHILNYGRDGLEQTQKILSSVGIRSFGRGHTETLDLGDIKITFLGYNLIGEQSPLEVIAREVARSKTQTDIVIVALHWGNEYTYQPTAQQITYAHEIINAGADIILGNHPHWVQPVEWYKNKLIIYSHGNFVMDQMWSRETREGIVARIEVAIPSKISAEFLPVLIENYSTPKLLDPESEEGQKILKIVKHPLR